MSSSRQPTDWTFFTASILGLAVAVLYLVVAWQRSGNPRNYLNGGYYLQNKWTMDSLDREIENWREEHGGLPESLKLLRDHEAFSVSRNNEGQPVDDWDEPIIYKIDGDDYELISYGEDRKPGGVWFDSDISNRKPFPPESFAPSSMLFLNSENAGGAIITALLTGLFCFTCAIFMIREEVPPADLSAEEQAAFAKRKVASMVGHLIGLAVIVSFAVGAAIVLGSVHLVHGEYH